MLNKSPLDYYDGVVSYEKLMSIKTSSYNKSLVISMPWVFRSQKGDLLLGSHSPRVVSRENIQVSVHKVLSECQVHGTFQLMGTLTLRRKGRCAWSYPSPLPPVLHFPASSVNKGGWLHLSDDSEGEASMKVD